MASDNRYLCIDLKSFFASVECVERGLDSMTTNLVVADPDRSKGTICLAVTPAMKALGVKNRCRIFEIPRHIKYIVAQPRMQKYIDYSTEIYGIYLKYISPDDMHVYSIDEVFFDVTHYLNTYNCTAKELAVTIMQDVYESVGIRATCGIGTNLYLAKIALDITAKHSPDFIGELDETSYKEKLWSHTPITDFWQIGVGTQKRLYKYGITTMGQIARADENLLYREFGKDAELLIDHANGIEPVTIADIKGYVPKNHSITSGQVLMRDYSFEEARLILREMTDALCLDLVQKGLVASSLTLYVGYSHSLELPPSKGTVSFRSETNSDSAIIPEVISLFGRITHKDKGIRRINISFIKVREDDAIPYQTSLFDTAFDTERLTRDKQRQRAVVDIKDRFGKNAILKGMSFQENATARERNQQIGGHKSGC